MHRVGDMLFSSKYGMGTVIEIVPMKRTEPIYIVQWHGGLYGLAEDYIQQLNAGYVGEYKEALVRIMERYTTGGVDEICRWEKERLKA